MNLFNTARFILMSLVVLFLWEGCQQHRYPDVKRDIVIFWNRGKAEKLIIPKEICGELGKAGPDKQILIYLDSNTATPILGNYELTDEDVLFRPLIPFTHGKTYKVYIKGKLVKEVAIDSHDALKPAVTEVYPTSDKVPENLLKIYIEFLKPMKEGEALQHISLIKNDRDTLRDVFLDLQPELWNNDRTILTLWFDPGRIKRDLQPNLKMGPPLTKGNKYTLLIRKEWEDQEGRELANEFRKDFITIERDSISPNLQDWAITLPKPGTKDDIIIDFKQPLDYLVAKNAIHILDKNKNEVGGKYVLWPGESELSFYPDSTWIKGEYYLQVEGRLEDLAGNNLDRLFDNDNTQKVVKNNTRMKLLKIE